MSAVHHAAVEPALEHVGLFYEQPDEAADRIATAIDEDLRLGRAVFVCLPSRLCDLVTDRVDAGRITIMDDKVRYARPVDAMAALWAFTQQSARDGSNGTHSIGQIAFDGTERDAPWHWYEAAVNDVFHAQALKATCLFDLRSTPDTALSAACATHPLVDGLGNPVPHAPLPDRQQLPRPAAPPDVHLAAVATSAGARHALRGISAHLAADVVQRAELVLSESVTNAVVHGGGAADVSVWVDDGITLEVSDDGPGCHDPFAGLRPPDLPRRGAGLWICHLESSRCSIAPRHPHGTVVRARID